MDNTTKRIFSLNLICYLRLHGFEEKSVGFNKNTKKVFFVFKQDKKLNMAIEDYKDIEAIVKLHDFISEFKELKSEMYQYSKDFNKE